MEKCILCCSKSQNLIKYGEFIQDKKYSISVHYFCLVIIINNFTFKTTNLFNVHTKFQLLTSNLIQRGDDDEGIYGFLIDDIRTEAHRIRNQV